MKLSVAIAVHNEEDNIIRALEVVYDWVDEIIIVDGDSTDKTVETIRLFEDNLLRSQSKKTRKIHIFNEPHEAMFHKNKQKSIEKCTGEWILQLDADEVVSDDLKKEIHRVILSGNEGSLANASLTSVRDSSASPQNDKKRPVAYWIPRLNYFLGKPLRKGGQYPDYTLRLYKNGVARFPCKSVHEQAEIRRIDVPRSETTRDREKTEDGRRKTEEIIGHLKTPLLHYPYPTFDEYLKKWSRYALLEADLLYKKGERPSLFNFIKYMGVYPKWWFFWTYIRHKGFTDGPAGFIFSLFSALRYCVTYTKLVELSKKQ